MANVKRWATGKIGNSYPDHTDRGNPNSKGLDSDGLPGIEAYIEEDPVMASNDNRPLKNLVENDGIISQNITDVASEVDNGIFNNKYDQFELTILPQDYHADPETGDEIYINSLRIGSGSAIVNGQVTRIGNQKLVYFYRSDDAHSILFPTYDESSNTFQVEIYDDDYFKDRTTRTFGEYIPVYNTLTETLPSTFEDYEVIIINRDTQDADNRKITVFDMYRDWEDIVPFKARSEVKSDEEIKFNSDLNFGQFSEGYWFDCGNVKNTRVSDVKIEKNIIIEDKPILASEFTQDGTDYVKPIVTDGLFFQDIKWGTNEYFDPRFDIQDLYVDNDESIYFIQRSLENNRLFKLSPNSTQIETKNIGTPINAVNLKIKKIGKYLVILGTKGIGVTGFITLFDTTQAFDIGEIVSFSNFTGTEDLHDISIWDDKVWIASKTKLWYTDLETLDPMTSVFIEINLNDYITDVNNLPIIDHVTKIEKVTGNYTVSSSLDTNIINLVENSSFEDGGIGNIPLKWNLEEQASGSQLKISSDSKKFGNYSAQLKKSTNSSFCSLVQTVDHVSGSVSYTASVDIKSNLDTTDPVKIYIHEISDTGTILNSSTQTIAPTTDWVRHSLSHTVVSTSVVSIKIEVRSEVVANTTECIYVDGVQLETGLVANEYVETFEYLMIGFKKLDSDNQNPPFAFIDKIDPYNIKYTRGKYGDIKSVNDMTFVGHNKVVFVDDKNVHSLVILNNRNEYDRFTISSLLNKDDAQYNSIKRFETIKSIGDKIYYGGIVDNRVIKIESVTPGEQKIELVEGGVGNGESLLTLLGGYTNIAASSSRNESVQFNRLLPCRDTKNNLTGLGAYIPSTAYSFKIIFNDDVDNAQVIQITSPNANNTPWTIDQIKNSLSEITLMSGLRWVETDVPEVDLAYPEWYKISSSVTVKDGFYSSNGKNHQTHIRGDIHSIFLKPDSNDFYIIKNEQIFKSKLDSNLLKVGSNFIPYNWALHTSGYSLENYNTVTNSEIVFSDDAQNHTWVDINIDSGYKILSGSLRVKTNLESEVGFSEGIDYFVDYDNARIIRSKNKNHIKNTSFSFTSGQDISNWTAWSNAGTPYISQYSMNSPFTKYAVKMYKDALATKTVFYQKITSQEILGVPTLQAGTTYTFSVYLQSDVPQNSIIRITECDIGNADTLNNDTIFAGKISGNSYSLSESNIWKRFDVSHTVVSSASTILRVEIHSNSLSQMFICKPMLEQNPTATPYIDGQKVSEIDPDSHVWLDFTQIKTMVSTSDYEFDASNRCLKLKSEPDANSVYYLRYIYTKIFNPYKFGDAKPNTQVIDYTDDDDYFLFELEGKIWAINQNLALLSLDDENPLQVSYKYYYPRIDQLKIRNSPDKYGNYLYLVQGSYHPNNPYRPVDVGITKDRYVYNTKLENISDITDVNQFNNIDNDMLFEINVTTNDYSKNDIYDRRIYIDAKSNKLFNISLYPETIAYFPFIKDFNSTNGLVPLNSLKSSKIVPIIKNYLIIQNSEVGAYHDSYQFVLRNNPEMIFPATAFSVYVDPIYGSDTNTGDSSGTALRSIKKALTILDELRCNIIITRNGIISENIEIDKPFIVKIFASNYCYWQGGLQNVTECSVQGVWFQNTNIYAYEKLNIFYCTFENSVINCIYPQSINVNNCEFSNCHNSIIRVKDTLFPSPFTHPYKKFALRDDGIVGSPDSIATSARESIAPGDSFYNSSLSSQPQGLFNFSRCLFHDSTDTLFQYDPNPDWISKFYLNYCTVAHNKSIFTTQKYNLNIEFENTVFYKNSVTVGSKEILFDSNSDVLFYNCFIDFSDTKPVSDYNLGSGSLLNRESCIGKSDTSDPGFIGMILGSYDYHLKSVAKGSPLDSVCLDKGVSGDIGVYDESREQRDKGLPKKLRTYVAYVGEGIVYPVRLNSEKITITLEFKPTGSISQSGIVFDSRSASDDEDYIILAYNNNDDEDHSLIANPTNPITNPYRFRVIVANKEKSYSVVSPIEIYTDEQFQNWHKISFTINYEEILNPKSTFVEKDKKQNIITLYHNDTVTIESFIKYDLNRFVDGELISGRGGENTNAWDFNTICQFITLGSDFDNANKMVGYYTELRLDNRFIDRKQFDMWNMKVVPFNDPLSYVNQTPLARTIDSKILSEYWSLKSKSDVGAKGNKFLDGTSKRYYYDNGEITWSLTQAVDNFYDHGAFTSINSASAIADSIIDWTAPVVIKNNIELMTNGSRLASDNTGISINLKNPLASGYSINAGYQDLTKAGITGATTTTLAAGSYKFRISINGGAVSEETITLDLNPTYQTIVNAMAGQTTGLANWTISTGIIRCTSETKSFAGTIAITAGTSADIIAALGLAIASAVPPMDQISINSKSELVSLLDYAFSQVVPQTLITHTFTKEGKLRFFTKDWGLASTVELTATMNSSDNVGLGFNTVTKTGERAIGQYLVSGLTSTNANPNGNVAKGNHIWTKYDPDYDEFGNNQLFIQKNNSSNEEDAIKVYQNLNVGLGYHTFSVYVYSNDFIDSSVINMYFNNNVEDFDEIKRYYGNWWVCSRRIKIESALTNVSIGIVIIKGGELVFGGMQFENSYYVSPFSEQYNTTNGKIILPRNIINKQSGVIAFKFKPLFDFYETDEKYIFEALGVEDGVLNVNTGYRVTYHYDVKKKRGIVKYSINATNSVWEVEVVQKFWNQWHTCIINYDFNVYRYVYWFDYYSNIVDESLDAYDTSDVYIGHGVIGATGSERVLAERSANIQVKDIIITNYPITDTETLNWVNTNEFYSESLIINTIDEYKNQIESYVSSSNNLVSTTNDLIDQVQSLSESVGAIGGQYSAVTQNYVSLDTEVNQIDGRVSIVENTVDNLNDQLNDGQNGIVTVINYMQDGNTGDWTVLTPGANLFELREDVDTLTTNLTFEATQRGISDLAIRNDMASTSTGSSGASLVGIEASTVSPTAQFSASTVESALREIAGNGRTTETVRGLKVEIDTIVSNATADTTTINLMKDGGDGTTWTAAHAANDKWNIAQIRADVDSIDKPDSIPPDPNPANRGKIQVIQENIAGINLLVGDEVTRLDGRIDTVYTDYASTAVDKGSSIIGFNNGVLFESTTVETAIKELAGIGRNSSMTVAENYSVIQTHTTQIGTVQVDISSLTGTVGDMDTELKKMKDGGDGTTWTNTTWNLATHEDRLDTMDISIGEFSIILDGNVQAIDGMVGRVGTLETGLATEIQTRQNADNLFKSTEVNKGASLIGINDSADNFVAIEVEGALTELAGKVNALAGSLAWKDAVATYNDLPVTGNAIGDARTVKADVDGHQAQYVCSAITGTLGEQWVKIADIDWGNASAISYSNTVSGLVSTDVNSAIDEVFERTKDPSKSETIVPSAGWTTVDDLFEITVTHNLGTTNVVAMVVDTDTGMVVGVHEIERVDANSIKVVTTEGINAAVTVFGVVDKFSVIANTWTPEGNGRYYHDIQHNFGTKSVMASVFDMVDGTRVGVDNIEYVSENTIRIHVTSNTAFVNVFVTKNVQNAITKDIRTWLPSGTSFTSMAPSSSGFDAVYAFFDTFGKTVEIESVKIENGLLKLTKSNGDPIRMIIIQ